MNTSQEIGELAEALSSAQAEFPVITRNREVSVKSDKGNYKFEYATLDHILELTKAARAKHGLALSWGCRLTEGAVVVVGRLMHSSGQWVESCLPVPIGPVPMKGQELGSALTYRKRYIADQLLGLSASEDDDANAEDGNQAEFRARSARQARAVEDFPPRHGPIGKPVEPPKQPPLTADALLAMDLKTLANTHATRLGAAVTREEIAAFGGSVTKKAEESFGLAADKVAGLREVLIGQLLGGGK